MSSSASSPELSPSSATSQLELETLREGDQGSNVANLQTQLSSLEFYQGDISGKFDAATKQALEAFQAQYEVTAESGVFGPQTWYALAFWSKETDLPAPMVRPAIKRALAAFVDAAARQPEPVLAKQAKPQRELEPGQILFWPPFGKKRTEAV